VFGEQSEQAEADNSLNQKPQCDANFHAEEAEGETQDPPSQPEDGAPNLILLVCARATRQKDIEGVLP